MHFERHLQTLLARPSLPVRVIVGPRQSGKSTLLAHLQRDATWLSLDDLQIRDRAEADPAYLLQSAGLEEGRALVLDEAAYAPIASCSTPGYVNHWLDEPATFSFTHCPWPSLAMPLHFVIGCYSAAGQNFTCGVT